MSQEFGMIEPNSVVAEAAKGTEAAALAAAKDLLFGSVAGMVGKVIEYPFDTVKVRLQSQPDDRPLRYRGPLDCFKQSLQQGGIRGLYRGITPPLIGAAAENSALFFSYNIAQNFVRRTMYPNLSHGTELPMDALVVCGAASGAFASFILTPIELVKCKMQVQAVGAAAAASHGVPPIRPAGPIRLVGEIYRVYGIQGMWHGQMGTFLRETGGSAAWFGAYEYVSKSLREWRGRKELTPGEMMISGAAAGVSYNFILFPADSVKSRMQTEAIGTRGEKAKGFFAVAKGMYRVGGISSLYRGCGITCLRSAPSSAIIFLVYESMKAYF